MRLVRLPHVGVGKRPPHGEDFVDGEITVALRLHRRFLHAVDQIDIKVAAPVSPADHGCDVVKVIIRLGAGAAIEHQVDAPGDVALVQVLQLNRPDDRQHVLVQATGDLMAVRCFDACRAR